MPAPPDRDAFPAHLALPAQCRYLGMLRMGLATAGEALGGDDEAVRDLRLAGDELASVIISGAPPGATLNVEVDVDGEDVYVRLHAPVLDRDFHPATPELTLLLLEATVDSFDLRVHVDALVGVLQRTVRRPQTAQEPHR